MKRTFPRSLKLIGIPIVAATLLLAADLAWEQTFLSWERGPQMVGFSLMHSDVGALLLLGVWAGLLWALAVLIAAVVTRSTGGRAFLCLLAAYALAWCAIAAPYGLWQRVFVSRYPPAHAVEFFTDAAAIGDLRTVKAFMAHGVAVNSQTRHGTALHAAAVRGQLEVMEYLIEHGADVNAVNPYGDSVLASAMDGDARSGEAQALLAKHGARLVRGTKEQHDRVIGEQVRRDIEEATRGMPK